MKKIVFMGMGAIGVAFAAQMQTSNYGFKVICDEKRKKRYLEKSFVVNGKIFDFEYETSETYGDIADLVIIAVKYHNLIESLEQLKNIVGKNTIIISLLNGIDSEDIIEKTLDCGKVIPSFVINIDSTKDDNIVNYMAPGRIIFGDKSGEETENIKILKNIFDKSKIDYSVVPNIIEKIWWKFMVNVGVNQMSGLLNASYGIFVWNEPIRKQTREVMLEVVNIANRKGINLSEQDIDLILGMYKNLSYDGKTSMLQDIVAKRKTEVEMFAGKVCEMGNELKIETPYNYMILNMFNAIEAMNEKEHNGN